jgi:hypothetical protein
VLAGLALGYDISPLWGVRERHPVRDASIVRNAQCPQPHASRRDAPAFKAKIAGDVVRSPAATPQDARGVGRQSSLTIEIPYGNRPKALPRTVDVALTRHG